MYDCRLQVDAALVCFLRLFRFGSAIPLGHRKGGGGIAGDVQGRTAHVEETVNTGNQGNAFDREVNTGEDHRQHDHAGTRNACRANGGKNGRKDVGNQLSHGQVDAIAGGDEETVDAHVDGRAVHVDRCAKGQNKGRNAGISAQVVGALNGKGQSRIGTGSREGRGHGGHHAAQEFHEAHLGKEVDTQTIDDHDVGEVTQIGDA